MKRNIFLVGAVLLFLPQLVLGDVPLEVKRKKVLGRSYIAIQAPESVSSYPDFGKGRRTFGYFPFDSVRGWEKVEEDGSLEYVDFENMDKFGGRLVRAYQPSEGGTIILLDLSVPYEAYATITKALVVRSSESGAETQINAKEVKSLEGRIWVADSAYYSEQKDQLVLIVLEKSDHRANHLSDGLAKVTAIRVSFKERTKTVFETIELDDHGNGIEKYTKANGLIKIAPK